jgi:hypothetical protein
MSIYASILGNLGVLGVIDVCDTLRGVFTSGKAAIINAEARQAVFVNLSECCRLHIDYVSAMGKILRSYSSIELNLRCQYRKDAVMLYGHVIFVVY